MRSKLQKLCLASLIALAQAVSAAHIFSPLDTPDKRSLGAGVGLKVGNVLSRGLTRRFEASPPARSDLHLPDGIFTSADPLAALRTFWHDFFVWQFPQHYFIQLYVITGVIGVIAVLGAMVLGRRLYTKQLWIIRIQETVGGCRILVPHTILAFTLVACVFIGVWLAFTWLLIGVHHWGVTPTVAGWMILLPWLPLWIAAWLGAWGTLYASPGWQSMRYHATSWTDARKWIPNPFMCNLILVGTPSLLVGCTVGITVPFGLRWDKAVHMWQIWDGQQANASGSITPEVLSQAYDIWEEAEDAIWWLGLGFLVWCFWAYGFGLFYFFVGFELQRTIRKQIREQLALGELARKEGVTPHNRPVWTDAEGDTRSEDCQSPAEEAALAETGVVDIAAPGKLQKDDEEAQFEANSPISSSTPAPQAVGKGNVRKGKEAETHAAMIERARQAQTYLDEEAELQARSTFWPPVRMDGNVGAPRTHRSRVKLLNEALRNLLTIWSSILIAIFLYAVAVSYCASVAIEWTARSDAPQAIVRVYSGINLATGWLNCVCGGLVLVIIWLNAFEPIFSSLRSGNSTNGTVGMTTTERGAQGIASRRYTSNGAANGSRRASKPSSSLGAFALGRRRQNAAGSDAEIGMTSTNWASQSASRIRFSGAGAPNEMATTQLIPDPHHRQDNIPEDEDEGASFSPDVAFPGGDASREDFGGASFISNAEASRSNSMAKTQRSASTFHFDDDGEKGIAM
ncbi:hypothetical protein IE81DRAFT_348455 [Ceraceosorus guamensis]|uniref:Uncharacterized protein n=1 Tax=Ceraceosorus guamensis TaxID=1522189 RepID=A0A316VV37_9BASI|nr:hypothetical protein IE81DRAFT_348455 [Ceraceosorus guamensis]PWN41302.1 hypothetical protein IE81DRAFT_348455 [Ceraceosorus guamensis]